MDQNLHQQLNHHLMKATLFFTLAKRYEYVIPSYHIHFYQKYFQQVQKVEELYWKIHENGMYI